MWATIPSRSRAGRSGWGSSGSRCSSTASTTCGSSSTTTCASCDSSHDDAHATGLGRTEPRRAFLRPPTEWAGPAALADRATGLCRTEPRRAFLRPPTEWAGPAAPVTMKIPYKWLQEFVDLRLSPAEAADRLTNAGIEVAAVTPLGPDVRGVVVGEIEAIERELGESHGHRLLLCRVSTGSQKFSVICGAPNTKVGVRAAFAPPGAVLPGDRRIGTTTIRGVESQGMLCSERELGIGLEHEAGIFVLDGDAPLGADLIAHLGLDDHVLDVEPTPNRPDCLSVLGVARELAALTDATIVVRRARAGERFTTLDGQARALDDSMLVIADPRRAIGIAGVMGGADTEVTDGTTRVLLESAWFDPVSIRRTSRALGLKTDAAYRFERGADIEALVDASARAAQLIAELAGGAVAHGMVDAYPRRRRPRRIRLRMERVKRVLGVLPPPSKAKAILAGLGLPTRQKGRDLEIEVPSFRRDLAMEDDLVEEIVRVWGYDKLPSVVPGSAGTPSIAGGLTGVRGALPPTLIQAQTVRQALVGAGLAEAITHAFSDPARAALLRAPGAPEPLRLLNPLSQDAALLRIHPLEGVLGAVSARVREAFGIDAPVFAAAVSLDVAAATTQVPLRDRGLPRFPAVQRDLAFVLGAEQSLTAAEIEAKLAEEAGALLRRVTLFDVFRFPDGRRSLAWRLTFQAEDRTLTDDEVNRVQEHITRTITQTFGITLRSA